MFNFDFRLLCGTEIREAYNMTHNIYFDFGETELDQLVESGYLEKLEKIEQERVMRITYRIKHKASE